MQNYIKTNIRKWLAVILAASILGILNPDFSTYNKEHPNPISNYISLISINYSSKLVVNIDISFLG